MPGKLSFAPVLALYNRKAAQVARLRMEPKSSWHKRYTIISTSADTFSRRTRTYTASDRESRLGQGCLDLLDPGVNHRLDTFGASNIWCHMREKARSKCGRGAKHVQPTER